MTGANNVTQFEALAYHIPVVQLAPKQHQHTLLVLRRCSLCYPAPEQDKTDPSELFQAAIVKQESNPKVNLQKSGRGQK